MASFMVIAKQKLAADGLLVGGSSGWVVGGWLMLLVGGSSGWGVGIYGLLLCDRRIKV